jgi:cyanophycin synthetase
LIKVYNIQKEKHNDLIIEEYIEGDDYRVCVVDYNIVAVALRTPPFVIGDGINNIKVLIRKLNNNPMRGYDHEKPLTKVKINNELLSFLQKQRISLTTIPKMGERIFLRENANLSTGGVAIDYTDKICVENKSLCVRAAKTIGLDICGIDIKAMDISKPLYGQGVIMEINAAPGIRMHEYPIQGYSKDVGEAILNLQYNGVPTNIPVVSITGTNGKTTTTRLISHVLRSMGYKVGMTSTDGIYVDGNCIDKGDDTGFKSAKTILLNKEVEVAVLETARGGLIKNGLAYDLADVAVITNITDDHIGMDSINSMEELAFVKSLVAEAVKEEGYVVLNGDDEWSRKIIDRIKGHIIFFSKSEDNPLIKRIVEEDGIAVYIKDDKIFVKNNKREYKIIDLKAMPIALGGVLEFNIENAMAACGSLVALGVDYCMISKGFRTFKLNNNHNSGRFNIYDLNGVKIILDYGHNVEGYKAILLSIFKMKKNKLIGVIGMPGDRRDESVIEIGELCGNFLDSIIIKEDKDRRGRKSGEMSKLLEEGVKKSGQCKNFKIRLDELDALKEAIKISKTGDIIIVFYEQLEPLINIINDKEYLEDNKVKIATR